MAEYSDRGLVPPETREVIERAASLLTKGHEETYRLMLLGAMLELAGHPLRGGVTARTNWVKSMRCLGETCMAIYRRTEGNAPIPAKDCRNIADCVGHRVGQIREAVAAIRAAAPADNDAESRRLLTECCYTIQQLAEQQAMPDNFYERTLQAVGRFLESDATKGDR